MKFIANLIKDDGFWLVNLDEFGGLITQGKTKKEAIFMLQDWVQLMVDEYFNANITITTLDIIGNDIHFFVPDKYAIPLVLLMLRMGQGKTIEEITKLCGFKSKNAYAQYEKGRRMPGVEQLSRLLNALGAKLTISC